MELLTSLGVDKTFWYQTACFIISFLALTQLVFRPYMRALHERENRTVGNEETAVKLVQEAHDLQGRYETKAKEVNSQIKSAFDASRAEAQKEYERLTHSAREEAMRLIDESRSHLMTQIQAARKAVAIEIPGVSMAIASRLAGKDMSQ